MAAKKICIVPAEGAAPGAGLAADLIRLWAVEHRVAVLPTSGGQDWVGFAKKCGAEALRADFNPHEVYNCDVVTAASQAVYQRLRGESFDLIVFPARGPAAFRSLQAARVLGEFRGSVLAVLGELETGGDGWPGDPLVSAKLAWVERYCQKHCDLYLDTAADGPLARPDCWRTLPDTLQPPARPTDTGRRPLISVCVPFYNHEKYLFQLYDSLKLNVYENYEVILMDDGSDRAEARAALEKLRGLDDKRWRFFSQPNQGPGAARNAAVQVAEGAYLVFMDSDNCAFPRMLETFARAMEISGADCLTCLFPAFAGDEAPGENTPILYRAAPYGACLEAGLLENVFGDTNFIIKREVFQALGGFEEKRGVIWEDYEFLARLCLEGRALEVVPEELFWYRQVAGGRNTSASLIPAHRRVAALYAAHLPEELSRLPESLLPLYYKEKKFRDFLNSLISRFLPLGSRRYRLVRSIWLALKKHLER